MREADYTVVIEPLSEEDGGGFVATVPDLPGCMSDGDTREEAARNIEDAIRSLAGGGACARTPQFRRHGRRCASRNRLPALTLSARPSERVMDTSSALDPEPTLPSIGSGHCRKPPRLLQSQGEAVPSRAPRLKTDDAPAFGALRDFVVCVAVRCPAEDDRGAVLADP